jgi:hypothetical protein
MWPSVFVCLMLYFSTCHVRLYALTMHWDCYIVDVVYFYYTYDDFRIFSIDYTKILKRASDSSGTGCNLWNILAGWRRVPHFLLSRCRSSYRAVHVTLTTTSDSLFPYHVRTRENGTATLCNIQYEESERSSINEEIYRLRGRIIRDSS